MISIFDRESAGRLLSSRLISYKNSRTIVLGLAKGGIVVAYAIAHELTVPLDFLVVKKIPSPLNKELAIGAVAPDGISVVDWDMAQKLHIETSYIRNKIIELDSEIEKKNKLYRTYKLPLRLKNLTVILVDDGIATGATFEAAVKWLRGKEVNKIIGAIPVASKDTLERVVKEVDGLVVLEKPTEFQAVGQFYVHFPQLTDEDVIHQLRRKG